MTRVALPWPHNALKPNAGSPFGKKHRYAKRDAAKAAKADAYALAYSAGIPALPEAGPICVLWTLCPPDKRHRDMDNAIASLKWHQDGVALAWGVNDARFQPTYRWADPVRGGRVTVEVMP